MPKAVHEREATMPELPDVEIERRHAQDWLVGRAVREVHVPEPGLLDSTSPAALGRRLHGRRLIRSRRHGKYLFLDIDARADPARMPADFLLPHREPGAACPRCDGRIERTKACGRTAFFCPRCQPRADAPVDA